MNARLDGDSRPNLSWWLGIGIVLLWLPVAVLGFWSQFVRAQQPLADGVQARALIVDFEAWFQAQPHPAAAATVVYVPASACRCAPLDAGELAPLRRRWAPHGVRFMVVDAAVPASLPGAAGFEVLVFSPTGRLIYAGALHSPAFCGGSSTLVDLALLSLNAAKAPVQPLLLPARCDCGGGFKWI